MDIIKDKIKEIIKKRKQKKGDRDEFWKEIDDTQERSSKLWKKTYGKSYLDQVKKFLIFLNKNIEDKIDHIRLIDTNSTISIVCGSVSRRDYYYETSISTVSVKAGDKIYDEIYVKKVEREIGGENDEFMIKHKDKAFKKFLDNIEEIANKRDGGI